MTRRQLDYEAMAHAILLADNLKSMSYRDILKAFGYDNPNSHEVRVLRRNFMRIYKGTTHACPSEKRVPVSSR